MFELWYFIRIGMVLENNLSKLKDSGNFERKRLEDNIKTTLIFTLF